MLAEPGWTGGLHHEAHLASLPAQAMKTPEVTETSLKASHHQHQQLPGVTDHELINGHLGLASFPANDASGQS